jgi:hypothetical protein
VAGISATRKANTLVWAKYNATSWKTMPAEKASRWNTSKNGCALCWNKLGTDDGRKKRRLSQQNGGAFLLNRYGCF